MKRILLLLTLLSFSMLSQATVVALQGVFSKKAAVLLIDGKRHVVDRGENVKGVLLEEIHPDHVMVNINGQSQKIVMSRQVGAQYKPLASKDIRIPLGEGGHYWVNGLINEKPVQFVVDTGATMIAMNLSMAQSLGIDYQNGQQAKMSTANGLTEARVVKLNSVKVGDIHRYNIDAIVAMSDRLPYVLLGNSFLSKVNITQKNAVMTLSSDL
jgi:aspartyl protease family protein